MEVAEEAARRVQEEKEGLGMEVEDKFQFPVWKARRRKLASDSLFFTAGNVERELLAKQVSLEITEEEKIHISRIEEEQCWETLCPVVGCRAKLKGLQDLEAHYFARHTAICSVCSRVFPTTRLLNLHVSEAHDSFFQAKAARGHPVYECLVEGCGARFQNDLSRHQHLIDKHKFPRSFQFHKRKHTSQRQRQRGRARQTLKQTQDGQSLKQAAKKKGKQDARACQGETQNSSVQMEVDVLTSAVSRLTTTDHMPSVVSFGRRHNRGFAFMPSKPKGGRVPETRYQKSDDETYPQKIDEQQTSSEAT